MGIWYSFRIALRALTINKGRTALTALGVIIGVAAVIAMVGLGEGFGRAITHEINAEGANWVYLVRGGHERNGPGPTRNGRITLADLEAIQTQHPDTIKSVLPLVMGSATVKFRSRSSSTSYEGSAPGFEREENVKIADGGWYTKRDVDGGVRKVVLGSKVVKDLTGSPYSDLTGQTVFVNKEAFLVCGTLRTKGQMAGFDQDNFIHIPYTAALRHLSNSDSLSQGVIEARNKDVVDRVQDEVRRTMRLRHGIKPPYKFNDDFHMDSNVSNLQQVNSITGIISLLLGCVAGISLFVGGIGIMNIMLVSVTERTREIGLRKAIGATLPTILSQFLIESVMVSLLGGLAGIAFGLLGLFAAAAAIRANTSIPMESAVSMNAITLAFCVSAAIGVVFGLYPAWRAARLDPISALRYE